MKSIKTIPYKPSNLEIEKISDTESKVIVYPFEKGYAITLAHPIRRLLLSSSVGFAPIALKIEGASHEFDTIRGMSEDVSIFIVNLKNIRFKLKDGIDRAELNYSFSGSRDITGADLENDQVEIITKDAHLATINSDAKLEFSVIIEKGIGYVSSEVIRNELEELASEYILIDAFFSPVRNIVYTIDNVLVEDNPNYERITFTVKTDGQIEPMDAFNNALTVMNDQMEVFKQEFNIKIDTTIKSNSSSTATEDETFSVDFKVLTQTIDYLGLNARSFNCLDRSEIKYIGELVLMNENELKSIKNLGKKSLDEIKAKLEEINYPVNSKDYTEKFKTQLKAKLESLKN